MDLTRRNLLKGSAAVLMTGSVTSEALAAVDPLPSWNEGQALEYTKAGDGARLATILLHDDAVREYAYGPAHGLPNTRVGTFTQELYDEATSNGWIVISMKKDWKRIFAWREE